MSATVAVGQSPHTREELLAENAELRARVIRLEQRVKGLLARQALRRKPRPADLSSLIAGDLSHD